jgi:hypothetical protein
MAAAIGAEMMTVDEYRSFMSKRQTDINGWCWLKTDAKEKKLGLALAGTCRDGIKARLNRATLHHHSGGLRCTLRV